VTVDI